MTSDGSGDSKLLNVVTSDKVASKLLVLLYNAQSLWNPGTRENLGVVNTSLAAIQSAPVLQL